MLEKPLRPIAKMTEQDIACYGPQDRVLWSTAILGSRLPWPHMTPHMPCLAIFHASATRLKPASCIPGWQSACRPGMQRYGRCHQLAPCLQPLPPAAQLPPAPQHPAERSRPALLHPINEAPKIIASADRQRQLPCCCGLSLIHQEPQANQGPLPAMLTGLPVMHTSCS